MSNSNLCIDLQAREDSDGETYYVGKLEVPANLDCKDGLVFLIFISDKGNEQLQITGMKPKEKNKDQNKDQSKPVQFLKSKNFNNDSAE